MAANVATLSVEGLDAVVLYAIVLEAVGVTALVAGVGTAAYATLSSLAGAAAFIAAATAFKEEWTKTIETTELYVYWVVSNACDPNALIGPGTPTKISTDPAPIVLDGGSIPANERANYEAEFENMGGLPAQLVEVDVAAVEPAGLEFVPARQRAGGKHRRAHGRDRHLDGARRGDRSH